MPRQKKNSPAKSPSPFRGESPPGVSQDSGADTGAADAAPLLPNHHPLDCFLLPEALVSMPLALAVLAQV